jgi:hypothetical protein
LFQKRRKVIIKLILEWVEKENNDEEHEEEEEYDGKGLAKWSTH